jgi:hypothetical protein
MKTLITALALATLIVAPAFTRYATAGPQNDVIVGGKTIGEDPDAKKDGGGSCQRTSHNAFSQWRLH